MDTPLFLVFLVVHIVSLIVGMGAVIVVDTFGLLWLMKRVQLTLVMRIANMTQRLIWIGWFGLVLSGIGLIILKGYVDNLTLMKLFFVALVGANGIFMHVIKKSLQLIDGNNMPPKLKFRIGFASTISQVGWWSAIAIGLLHRQWRHFIDWPRDPVLYMAAVVAGILFIALVGELVTRRKV